MELLFTYATDDNQLAVEHGESSMDSFTLALVFRANVSSCCCNSPWSGTGIIKIGRMCKGADKKLEAKDKS